MKRRERLPAWLAFPVFLACSEQNGELPPRRPAELLDEHRVEGSSCAATRREYELMPSSHVAACEPLTFVSNPPSSGDHYGQWAAFRTYTNPVPRGFWVHSMEHGAVVIAYSCTECEDEVAAAQEVVNAAGVDPACCTTESCEVGSSRVILVPDPLLGTRWAAASWGHTLTADCFEPEPFADFLAERRGHGFEAVCADGVDLTVSPCDG